VRHDAASRRRAGTYPATQTRLHPFRLGNPDAAQSGQTDRFRSKRGFPVVFSSDGRQWSSSIPPLSPSLHREVDLEADQRAARSESDPVAIRTLETEIQSIQDSYRRLSFWPLIEAGEFSALAMAR
jgi:hypothetical protein